ncbi:MAG: DUF4339 domain-containing protein [Methylocystis sp.]
MSGDGTTSWLKKGYNEIKKLLGVALYFWVLFTLFAFHKAILDHDRHILIPLGIALINSKLMAKVVYLGEHTRLNRRFNNKPLIYTILFKSFVFAIVLFVFRVLEEILIGVWEGRSFYDALAHDHPAISQGGAPIAIAMVCIIMFVALIPFFAYREIEDAFGHEVIRNLLFKKNLSDFKLGVSQQSTDPQPSVIKQSSSFDPINNSGHWYYASMGNVCGPYTRVQFLELINKNKLSSETLVWNESISHSWRPLHSIQI